MENSSYYLNSKKQYKIILYSLRKTRSNVERIRIKIVYCTEHHT